MATHKWTGFDKKQPISGRGGLWCKSMFLVFFLVVQWKFSWELELVCGTLAFLSCLFGCSGLTQFTTSSGRQHARRSNWQGSRFRCRSDASGKGKNKHKLLIKWEKSTTSTKRLKNEGDRSLRIWGPYKQWAITMKGHASTQNGNRNDQDQCHQEMVSLEPGGWKLKDGTALCSSLERSRWGYGKRKNTAESTMCVEKEEKRSTDQLIAEQKKCDVKGSN